MKIYVFGGAGFLGQHLIRELSAKDYTPVICDIVKPNNSSVEHFVVDIRDVEQLEKIPFSAEDIVINLAANQYHMKVPKKDRRDFFFRTNAVAVDNILSEMQRKGCHRLIQFTTDMTYGVPEYLPVDTCHPQQPFGYYGESKKEAEQICKRFRGQGFNVTIFRPRMIVGPGRAGILVKLFKLIDFGIPVPTIGSGKNHYQMISVFDCVSATIAAIEKQVPNAEYNLGSKNPPSTKELLQAVITEAKSRSIVLLTWAWGVKFVLATLAKIGIEIMYKEQYMIADKEYILDISKTEEELGWKPQYNDRDMIMDAYKTYKSAK
ncbi:MAG: NAD(P)-dependent oxidoreductase [bacterium]